VESKDVKEKTKHTYIYIYILYHFLSCYYLLLFLLFFCMLRIIQEKHKNLISGTTKKYKSMFMCV